MSMFKLTFVESWLGTTDSSSGNSSQRRMLRVESHLVHLFEHIFKHEYYTDIRWQNKITL